MAPEAESGPEVPGAESGPEVPEAAVDAFDAGMRAFIAEENGAAAASFLAAVEAFPPFHEAHYLLGLTHARLGETDAAIAQLRMVVAGTDNVMLRDYAIGKLKSLGAATDEA